MSLPIYTINFDELNFSDFVAELKTARPRNPVAFTWQTKIVEKQIAATEETVSFDFNFSKPNYLWGFRLSALADNFFTLRFNGVVVFRSVPIKANTKEYVFDRVWKIPAQSLIQIVYENKLKQSTTLKLEFITGGD